MITLVTLSKHSKNIKNEFINDKNSLIIPLESEKVPYDVFILQSKNCKELIVDSDITPNIFIKNNHILSKKSSVLMKKK